MNGDSLTYFDIFGAEYMRDEIKKIIGNKDILINIYIIQANDLIICGYFCIRFLYFMLVD